MTNLKNHPGKWLSPAAAASLERLERDHGVISINSAGRTAAEQAVLITRYYVVGGPANRPPNLFAPARPAEASRHVVNGGQAFDTNNISHMLKYGQHYGWFQNFAYDPVHFEYDESRDQSKGGSAPINHGSKVVQQEQAFLNEARGEKLDVDGINGDATKAAIKRYQEFLKQKFGYKGAIDGVWGPSTQAAHSVYYASRKPKPRPTIRRGTKDTMQTKILQERINGLFPGVFNLKNDAIFGKATEDAVKRVQKHYGLTRDGIVGRATWEALGL
jgi:peptidoglycan hydrolase-like protein with peptidoglycan-binding domain